MKINKIEIIKTELGFAKTSGQYRYELAGKYLSKNYDTNDLGLLFYNNYHNAYANGSYRIVNPTKTFNSFSINETANLEIENTTGKLQTAAIGTEIKASTLKNDSFQLIFQWNTCGKEEILPGRRGYVWGRIKIS